MLKSFLQLTEAHNKHSSMTHGAYARCVGMIYELFGEGLCLWPLFLQREIVEEGNNETAE